jgi:hypothetical protein
MTNKNFNTNIKTRINKSLNFKTMRINYLKNTLKLGMTALFIMALGTANAQTSDASDASLAKGANAIETIKIIDNKGTIKYLQSNNGITSITSTSDGSKTTTTWQLGGALVDATTITTSATGTFTIDGVDFNLANTELSDLEASDAADLIGYTFLVRDELTGGVKKMLATDLVKSAYALKTVDAPFLGLASPILTIAGIGDLPTEAQKISVYRNGAKLLLDADYSILTNVITLTPSIGAGWALNDGDIIEVEVLKF